MFVTCWLHTLNTLIHSWLDPDQSSISMAKLNIHAKKILCAFGES